MICLCHFISCVYVFYFTFTVCDLIGIPLTCPAVARVARHSLTSKTFQFIFSIHFSEATQTILELAQRRPCRIYLDPTPATTTTTTVAKTMNMEIAIRMKIWQWVIIKNR